MAVSQIAKDTLLATNRASQLGKFEKLILALNPFTDGQSNSFAEAAVWADDIKSYGAKFFDNYHFINMYLINEIVCMTRISCSKA